jgi:hypothetical protein
MADEKIIANLRDIIINTRDFSGNEYHASVEFLSETELPKSQYDSYIFDATQRVNEIYNNTI